MDKRDLSLDPSRARVQQTEEVPQEAVLVGEVAAPHTGATQSEHHGQHLEAVRVGGLGCLGAGLGLPVLTDTNRFLADGLDDVGAHLVGKLGTLLNYSSFSY